MVDDINLYSYVGNNSINYTDPSGLGKVGVVIKIGKAAWKHISKRHIARSGKLAGKSKFAKPSQINKLIQKTVQGADKIITQSGGKKLFQKAFNRTIGTRGEQIVRVAVDKFGKVITSFPAKEFLSAGATIGVSVFGDNAFGATVDFLNPLSDVQDIVDLFDEDDEDLSNASDVCKE